MSISVRTRFEVFKRDDFTCGYCGKKSPSVVLEVDHIKPLCEGGSNDPINLRTSCWECNRGKGGVPLERVITGEDPTERAVMILEQERQLAEYNAVVAAQRKRREDDLQALVNHWCSITYKEYVADKDLSFLKYCLTVCPVEKVKDFMEIADGRRVRKLQYVHGIMKNWLNSIEGDDVPNY